VAVAFDVADGGRLVYLKRKWENVGKRNGKRERTMG
jgi:hypothetical protein